MGTHIFASDSFSVFFFSSYSKFTQIYVDVYEEDTVNWSENNQNEPNKKRRKYTSSKNCIIQHNRVVVYLLARIARISLAGETSKFIPFSFMV